MGSPIPMMTTLRTGASGDARGAWATMDVPGLGTFSLQGFRADAFVSGGTT